MPNKKETPLPAGKLPSRLLGQLLRRHCPPRPELLIGPGIGSDAAALKFDESVLLAATDPITFVTEQPGWYAVVINANDIACLGGTPRWLLATLLLPPETSTATVETLFDELAGACAELAITLVGGHTEITPAVTQPVLVGTMLGETTAEALLDVRRCQPNDRILLVSGIAIEAVSILARSREAELHTSFDDAFLQRCRNFTREPGISVVQHARLARDHGGVRAMHDPTEGGLATALHELADACQLGLEIDEERILVLPEAKLLCDYFGVDVLGIIASGALLVVAAPEQAPQLMQAYAAAGVPVADIGRLTSSHMARLLCSGRARQPLPRFDQDEIVRVLG